LQVSAAEGWYNVSTMSEDLKIRQNYQVILGLSDRAELRKQLNSPDISTQGKKNIKILLTLDESDGKIPELVPVIAKRFGVSPAMVVRIRRRFVVCGKDAAIAIGSFGERTNILLTKNDRLNLIRLISRDNTPPHVRLRANILLDSDTLGENTLSVDEIAQKYSIDKKTINDTRYKYVCHRLGFAIMYRSSEGFVKNPLTLSSREKAALTDIMKTDQYSAKIKNRAQVLLALDESEGRRPKSLSEVAKDLGQSRTYISTVQDRYNDYGISSVTGIDRRYGSTKRNKHTIALSEIERQELHAIISQENITPQIRRWTQIILDSDIKSQTPSESVATIAKRHGVSTVAVINVKKKYRAKGIRALTRG
jgi:transposase